MNTIIERITEAIKDILIGLIKSSLDNMFTSVNEQVGTIAGQVGQTPQGWNAGIFNLIQNISQTVIVPIAGLIITFVLCYELITMVTQKNNFHEFETYNIFLWIFKAYVAIYLVTNTFNITIARIAGWSAHRLEELITTDKIIRPAYKSLVSKKEYIEREER